MPFVIVIIVNKPVYKLPLNVLFTSWPKRHSDSSTRPPSLLRNSLATKPHFN